VVRLFGKKKQSVDYQTQHEQGWTCKQCGKFHSHRHWKDGRQTFGQKKWANWEGKADGCKDSDPRFEFDPLTGLPRPRFCPHCGYEEERLILVIVR